MATKKKKQYVSGGQTLAKIKGYHSLLAQRSHGLISKETFKRRSRQLLAVLNRTNVK